MNKDQLRKLVGKSLRLRPIPTRSNGDAVDDLWSVDAVDNRGLQLKNVRTGHCLQFAPDHVAEFRTPDFLILKSTVQLTDSGVVLEPIVTPPKVVLNVRQPVTPPMQGPDGRWVQEVHVVPSRPDAVPDATVEVLFAEPYETASYAIVRDDPREALSYRELFGPEGASNAARFRIGIVELPRRTSIRLVFIGKTPPSVREIRLTPYSKH